MNININSIDISIIIPIYNTEKYLKQCIDSVLSDQNSANIEVILINDGSTDQTGYIINEYAKKDHRVKVVHQINSGIGAARNTGLNIASGEYIAFLDSDDWLNEGMLKTLFTIAKKQQSDIVMGNTLYYYSENNIQRHFNNIPQSIIDITISGKDAFLNLMRNLSFPPLVYSYIYKRSWLKDVNMSFADILHEDELWVLTSMCQAKNMYITNIDFYLYRQQRENSVMTSLNIDENKIKQRISSLFYIVEAFFDFAQRFTKKEDLEIKGWIYLKLFQMYYLACESLFFNKNLQLFFTVIPDLSHVLDLDILPNETQKKLCYYYYHNSLTLLKKIVND